MNRFTKALCVLGSGAALFSMTAGDAQANIYSGNNGIYSCNGSYTNTFYVAEGDGVSTSTYDSASNFTDCLYNNTGNQSSAAVTANNILRTAAVQTTGIISNRIANALGGGAGGVNVAANSFSASQGISAGNGMYAGGLWVAGGFTDLEDENADTGMDGNVYSGLAGVDFHVSDATIIGLAVGYENVDVDTSFNGSSTEDGNIEGDGYTVAPYVGFNLGDGASANITVGYSDLSYDMVRFDPISDERINGSTDAERYFVSAAAGGSHMLDASWRLRGNASVFYANEEQDDYTETYAESGLTGAQSGEDTDFGQLGVNARLGYVLDGVEPYALAGVEYDFSKDDVEVATTQTSSDDDFGARFGAGLDLNLGSGVTGGIEAYTVEFREDYNEYNVTGGLRINF